MNLANKLTMARVAMVPLFVLSFYIRGGLWLAALLFALAFLTDLLDGYVARKRNEITTFGKFMDPMADKLLTVSAMVMLSAVDMVSPIATIIVIGRELAVSGLRLLVVGDGVVVPASWLGKVKTMSQFIAIMLVLLGVTWLRIDQAAIWLSVFFTIWSGVDYFNVYKKHIDFTA